MPTTPNLEITHVEQNQDGHAVTVSEALDDLDGALTADVQIDVTSADATLTDAQALRNLVIEATGTPGVARSINVPDGNQKLYVLLNNTDAAVTLKTVSGTGVEVLLGETLIAYADGTNVVSLASAAGGLAIEKDGISALDPASILNFKGTGVSVVDAGGGRADVTIDAIGSATDSYRYTHLQTIAPSDVASGAVNIDIALPSGYDAILIEGVYISDDAASFMDVYLSTSGVSAFEDGASDYAHFTKCFDGSAGGFTENDNDARDFMSVFARSVEPDLPVRFRAWIWDYDDASKRTRLVFNAWYRVDPNELGYNFCHGERKVAKAHEGIRFRTFQGLKDAKLNVIGVKSAGSTQVDGLLPVAYRGCLLQLGADDTGISFPYIVPWDSAAYDTDSIWSSSNATRLTVPAGVTRVRLSTCIELEGGNDDGGVYLSFYKNGVNEVLGSGSFHVRQSSTGFTNNIAQFVSPVLNVTAGDYFEVRINQFDLTGVDQLLAGDRTWAALEIVETSDALTLTAGNARRLLDDDSTADGVETDFTLSAEPAGGLLVFLDGVLQDEDDFSIATTTLTFSTAPPSGAKVIAYDVGSNTAAVRTPYEVEAFVAGTPSAGQLIKAFVFARDVEFPDDFAGSQLFAGTAATSETVFDLQKNGAAIGTITVVATGATGAFATIGAGVLGFAEGDRITILAPDPADATLADIAITLKGTRTS